MAAVRAEFATCWICGNQVSLEQCKIDEHGRAVHEKCCVVRLALAKNRSPSSGAPRKRSSQS